MTTTHNGDFLLNEAKENLRLFSLEQLKRGLSTTQPMYYADGWNGCFVAIALYKTRGVLMEVINKHVPAPRPRYVAYIPRYTAYVHDTYGIDVTAIVTTYDSCRSLFHRLVVQVIAEKEAVEQLVSETEVACVTA